MVGQEKPPTGERALVAALLLVFLAQSVGSMRLLSATSDETSHLPSGYSYVRTGLIRLNPQHPPLVKELCALPLLLLGPRIDLEHPAWKAEPPDEWSFGRDFLYSNDADRLLFWGRLPVVLLGLLLGLYVYRWGREMLGPAAALTALFLYALCPNVIAHSHLVTMDLGLACFGFAALHHLWRFTRHGRLLDLALSGLGLGLALATKFSATILVPITGALLGLAALRKGPGGVALRLGRSLGAWAVTLGLAAVVVWAAYLFPSDPLFYWRGLQKVNQDHNPNYAFYLLGRYEYGGWWYYFLVAFLLKTPLPTLLLLVLSPFLARRHPAGSWLDWAFMILPVAVFTTFTSALADNIGLRYLLPVYPFLFLLASRAGGRLVGSRAGRVAAGALGAWYVAAALLIYPNHLAYFNEAAGGPGNGWRWLDDSNVEWGQGLKQLKAYLDRRGIDRVKLRYGWNGSPEYYGIVYDEVERGDWQNRPSPGIYAISTQVLIRGRFPVKGLSTDWLTRYRPADHVGYAFYIFEFR